MKKKKIFLFIFATILVLDMALFLVPSLLTIFSSNKLFYGAKMLYSFSNFEQYNKTDYINNGLCFATFILIIILSYVGIIFILKKDTIKENTRNVKARRKEENSSIEINIKSKVHSNFIFALFLILIISVISIFILPNNISLAILFESIMQINNTVTANTITRSRINSEKPNTVSTDAPEFFKNPITR